MKRVLITGVSGFVGLNLIPYLENSGYTTSCISLRNLNWKKELVLMRDAEAIIHLAGKAHDTSNTSLEDEYYKINRDLTVELFEEFLNSEIKYFFYFSSVKAAADTVDGVLKEDVVELPKTPYGKSKLEAEKLLLAHELPFDKKLFIIRPCMIHGPGNKGNLNLLYKVVNKGIPWPLGSFDNKRSFLNIENLCFLILKMLTTNNLNSGIYNFSDDEALSTNRLVEIISHSTRNKAKIWHLNKQWITLLAKLGDQLSLPLNSERLKKLTESYVVSNQKIKEALKIEHLPISSEAGLKKTIESFNIVTK